MSIQKRTVLVTGIAGSLGAQLFRQLADFDVIGADLKTPASDGPARFHGVDLEREASCGQVIELLRDTNASAVVHLAFVSDPQLLQLQPKRCWQINVAGTARVLEAIAVVNRTGGHVRQFVMPSSTLAYGPGSRRPAVEEARLMAERFPLAAQERAADETAQFWAESLGECRSYVLRSCSHAGPNTQGYLLDTLRGIPPGESRVARSWREKGRRLQVWLPFGQEHLLTPFQFVHVEDMARLIAWILRREGHEPELTVLNVTGRGEPVTLERCIEVAEQKVFHLPGTGAYRRAIKKLWERGLSSIPPEALPYMLKASLADTARLQHVIGSDYPFVIQHTMEEALQESFPHPTPSEQDEAFTPATPF
jgi:nucleoside-diphosphate-sugar epimerase